MADPSKLMGHTERFATPLHVQRLERSLTLNPFLSHAEKIFNDSSSDEDNAEGKVSTTREERRSDKSRLFNTDNVGGEREGLRNALISDTSDDSLDGDGEVTEERFQEILRQHVYEKKMRRKYYLKSSNSHYQYYGTGLLSNYDKYPGYRDNLGGSVEGESSVMRKSEVKLEVTKPKRGRRAIKKENSYNESLDLFEAESDEATRDEYDDDGETRCRPTLRGRGRRKSDKGKSPEVMAMRRRKILAMIAKKEVGKCQRSRLNNHKEVAMALKKVAQMCTKHWKQKAMQSQKNMKETVWRNKRLAREMQAYWKRYERVERDTRRRQEKEAEEQRRMDLEFMEAKRQQRKLNFLITQTELYAHFISKKINSGGSGGEKQRILNQLDEEANPRMLAVDDYNSEDMKTKAVRNVERAVDAEHARSRAFEVSATPQTGSGSFDERPQPAMFRGTLKHYQLKGMNWLANLYDQGINGILADEMGLGKTVQSIAFLCHIAEKYAVWGPFLIISPASTLHNWQQEMQRFVPDFKVVPYWGNVQERRILRQFWDQKDLHTKEASFHVVITSYQLVITDFKYFNRIKWQYLILDEAQAIKSSNSMRWKLLLGFSCRNRLLLSGTPIQNSMAELWALLHFIMPTLFDNHEEFSEWFSKDIEGQAENKTRIDERHLSRLHLILKPFMLRRIKKDVENELSDKIEVMVYCPLTTRQKLLYAGLKQKIRVEDLLAGISGRTGPGEDPSRTLTSNLMNLVMQFRKVCNHPELFERREAWSPLCLHVQDYVLPKLVYEDAMLWRAIPSMRHITHNLLSILTVENIHRNLFKWFGFLRMIGLSSAEAHAIFSNGILGFWLSLDQHRRMIELGNLHKLWSGSDHLRTRLLISCKSTTSAYMLSSPVLRHLVFTRLSGPQSRVYTHTRHVHYSMPETLEHRVMRSQKIKSNQSEEVLSVHKAVKSPTKCSQNDESLQSFILPEFPFIERPPIVFDCVPTEMPEFLYQPHIKVQGRSRTLYASCRTSAWESLRHTWCSTPEGHDTVWYGHPNTALQYHRRHIVFHHVPVGGLLATRPEYGWSNIVIPDKQTLVADAGKLYVLDGLLRRLKEGGHRVLIYSQMTRMIDLLEEYMWHRKHTYMRLDGSSKISERRDMVADFQARADIFVFLLSTRAGGLGINLTAADTVIFYDSDWNPTVDQQAMDRAHRLGQTKQVTVYRLICKGTIEERMLQRAREKSEIQRMVISGGNFKPDHLKPKEVVSLLLDDEEMAKKYQQKQAERKIMDDRREVTDKMINLTSENPLEESRRMKLEPGEDGSSQSTPHSPGRSERSAQLDDTSNDGLVVDVDSPLPFSNPLGSSPFNPLGIGSLRLRPVVRGSKRGRPRGVRRGGSNAVRKRSYDTDIKLPGEMFISGESPSSSADSSAAKRARALGIGIGVKRGPGRPRMKPFGPAQQGTRGARGRGSRGPRGRRAHAPLQVPLARASSSSSSSTAPRAYGFYDPAE